MWKKSNIFCAETPNQHNSQVGTVTAFVKNGCTKRVPQVHHHYNQSSVKINLGWTYVALLFLMCNFDDLPFNGGWNFQQETSLMQHVSQLSIWSLGAIKQVAIQKNPMIYHLWYVDTANVCVSLCDVLYLLSQAQDELLCTGTSSKGFKFKDFNNVCSYVGLIFWAHHEPWKLCPNIKSPFGFPPNEKATRTSQHWRVTSTQHGIACDDLDSQAVGPCQACCPPNKMITLPETNTKRLWKEAIPKGNYW